MEALQNWEVLDRVMVFLVGDARSAAEVFGDVLVRQVLKGSRQSQSGGGGSCVGLGDLIRAMASQGVGSPTRSSISIQDQALLAVLHGGDQTFSYVTLASQLELKSSGQEANWEVAQRVHSARMKWAWSRRLDFPRWNQIQGEACPELDVRAPWMQRVMDREYEPRVQSLITTHVAQCSECLEKMNRYRYFHTQIESAVRKELREIETRGESQGWDRSTRHRWYQKLLRDGVRLTRGIRIEF
jgi:hypothetical protein